MGALKVCVVVGVAVIAAVAAIAACCTRSTLNTFCVEGDVAGAPTFFCGPAGRSLTGLRLCVFSTIFPTGESDEHEADGDDCGTSGTTEDDDVECSQEAS